jgi:hypothetical protein
MDEKDDEIAPLFIITKPGIAEGLAPNQQWTVETTLPQFSVGMNLLMSKIRYG